MSGATIEATFSTDIKTVSEANARGHWAQKARRAKAQRSAARVMTRWALHGATITGTAAIEIIRQAPGRLDGDNLQVAMKAVRDGIADAIGIDDGDERLTWTYGQERAKGYGVRITIKGEI